MLRIPVRKKWWKMEYDGEKLEDYREIGDYWRKRFQTLGLLDEKGEPVPDAVADVILVNGYGPKAPELLVRIMLRIGTGEPKWGAEPGKKYYVLPILTARRIR